MSNNLDANQLTNIITEATEKIVNKTETTINTLTDNVLGSETVTVMLNGVETTLNKIDYEQMKAETSAIHAKMKNDIKAVVSTFKESNK